MRMFQTDGYSFAQLVELSGVAAPTIRSWMRHRLLPGPEQKGRHAYYDPECLTRVHAVKTMRERGVPISEIRVELDRIDPSEIEGRDAPHREVGPTEASETTDLGGQPFIQRRYSRTGPKPSIDQIDEQPSPSVRDKVDRLERIAGQPLPRARLAAALEEFEEAFGEGLIPREAKGEAALRIPVTQDVELIVGGNLTQTQKTQFERIADVLREYLTKG